MLYKLINIMAGFLSKTKMFVILCITGNICFSQNKVFQTSENYSLRTKVSSLTQYHDSKSNVNKTYSLVINSDIFNSNTVSFGIRDNSFTAKLIKKIVRSKNDFTWFGKTNEGEGIFFYVKNGKIASKFTAGNYSYTLIPSTNNNHILVEYTSTYVGECGVKDEVSSNLIQQSKSRKSLVDDECTYRALIATTPAARTEITASGLDVSTFAQIAIDEANLAYINSKINLTLELGVLMNTDYTETTSMRTDMNNFRNGVGGLAITHTYIDLYQTDIQVLISPNRGGLFGIAYVVTNDDNPLDAANMFCIVSVNGVTDGRYTFTHELGHLQGGRHEDHNSSPSYARGFASGTTLNSWRTIMARTGAAPCDLPNSCRIGQFSNPDLTGPGGSPAGTSDRDNTRMLNEQAIGIRNLRLVPSTLSLQNETIVANTISNHLAHDIIDTNNRAIVYEENSLATMRSGNKIILKPGTHITSGATYRAYINNDACETLPSNSLIEKTSGGIVDNSELIKVHPNPTKNNINIETDEKIESWSLLNAFGKSFISGKATDKVIGTRNLDKGIYVLRFVLKNGEIITKKVIKE